MEITPSSQEIVRIPTEKRISFPKGKLAGIDFVNESIGFHRGPNQRGGAYRLILFSFAATAIDILLGLAFSSLFILTSSLVMRVKFWHCVEFFNGSLLKLGFVSFIASVLIEQMILRMFLGFTVGEWACGLRLGSSKERLSSNYVFRVFLRSMVNLFSGFVLLPLISIFLGQDLAGRISGLYLVSHD